MSGNGEKSGRFVSGRPLQATLQPLCDHRFFVHDLGVLIAMMLHRQGVDSQPLFHAFALMPVEKLQSQ
ncbi:MAG: hypothetical protein PVG45_06150 [Gammaproteobacteria bacterium]|jgi:hypothetical protein